MQAIIIAAGESSRFWPLNRKHKSQINLFGKPLVYWTVKGLAENGVKEVVLVVSPKSTLKKENTFSDLKIKVSLVVQKKPLGTGNAVLQAEKLIKEPFFVFWPHKINSAEIAENILEKYKGSAKAVLVASKTTTPWEYGILKFKGDRVIEIIENPKKRKEPSNFKLGGTYLFEPDFFEYYRKIKKHHEEDFVDALNAYMKEKEVKFVFWKKEPASLKYPWDLLGLMKIKFREKNFKNYVSPKAEIGKNVVINGNVYIEKGANIGDNSTISGPCYIGENCKIGANNVLRGPVNMEKEVKTGVFMEIKNSIIQQGTHFHSGYLGDSIVGKDCRFGAGFIVANRRIDRANIKSLVKGKKIDTNLSYLGVVIGDNSRFGIRSGVMPGILIGSNCSVGPATIIFKNMEDGMSVYSEFKKIKKILK